MMSSRRAVFFTLVLACMTSSAQDTLPAPASAEELERVRTRIQALQERLDRDRGRRDELQERLDEAERRIAGIAAQLRELRQQLATQAQRVRRTQAERNLVEQALAAQRKALGQQVRATYVVGQRGRTKLLLNQDGTQRLTRVLTYYEYLGKLRSERIRAILNQVEQLKILELRLRTESEELGTLHGRQQGVLQALEAGRLGRNSVLSRLALRIRGEVEEMAQLQASEREMARLLESLRDALADIPLDLGRGRPFAELKGRLPWPTPGKLLAAYGQPKAGGKLKWNGIWIAAPEGEPVQAVARGRVAYVGWMHRYGLIVVLEHEGGYYSLYGHSESVSATVGEWLDAGTALATVGNSGGHDRTGVYFELRKGTEPVNPRSWLRRKK